MVSAAGAGVVPPDGFAGRNDDIVLSYRDIVMNCNDTTWMPGSSGPVAISPTAMHGQQVATKHASVFFNEKSLKKLRFSFFLYKRSHYSYDF